MKKSDIDPMPPFFEVYIHQVEDLEIIKSLEDNLTILEGLDANQLE